MLWLASVPANEEHKLPMYPYALSKYLGEMSVFIGTKYMESLSIQLEFLMHMQD